MAETNNTSGATGAPEEEHHHHHHHHRSPAPIHEMHKVQRRIKHTMKHLKKWQVVTAAATAAALLVFAGVSVQKYREKKRTEAENAAWLAQNVMPESQNGMSALQNGSPESQNGVSASQNGTDTKEIDYGAISNNMFNNQLALRRPQPFVNKEVLYNGQRYTRNTAVKAILLMGLDRKSDDLKQIRPELWEQGQTDLMVLIAHTFLLSVFVEILQYVTGTGLCEFDDVFNNSLGGLIGFGLAMLAVRMFPKVKGGEIRFRR